MFHYLILVIANTDNTLAESESSLSLSLSYSHSSSQAIRSVMMGENGAFSLDSLVATEAQCSVSKRLKRWFKLITFNCISICAKPANERH